MNKKIKITEEMFNGAKKLRETTDFGFHRIATQIGSSSASVHRMLKFPTYQEFRNKPEVDQTTLPKKQVGAYWPKKFALAKTLNQAGLDNTKIAEAIEVHPTTIKRWLAWEGTYEAYAEAVKVRLNTPKVEKVNPEVTTNQEEIKQEIKSEEGVVEYASISNNLSRVADAVERLADAWEAKPYIQDVGTVTKLLGEENSQEPAEEEERTKKDWWRS